MSEAKDSGLRGFRIGSVLGFEIRLDASWFIIFFLVLWTLSAGVFPAVAPGQSTAAHLVMGAAGTLLFFASLLLHEISHSLVARSKGIPMRGITLFLFGGLAHTSREPDTAADELQIAGIGPVVSLLLGVLFLGLAALGRGWGWSPAVHEVSQYLGFINVALAVFNMLPGYPLDGGRIFRALSWKLTGDLAKATRWATTGGRWIGLLLIVLGILDALAGALLGGLWLVFIGFFLRGAAGMASRQFELEQALRGVHASQVMYSETSVLESDMTLEDVARGPAMRSTRDAFLVRDDGHVVGRLTLDELRETPREAWPSTAVGDVMSTIDDQSVVRPETDMREVLTKIRASEAGQVFVMENGTLLGSISARDLADLAARAAAFARARARRA
jgi:Zn-dependent protease/CBS domain-containing protein